MEDSTFIHIEFFYSTDCPYCPSARKLLAELIESELGLHIIIEEVNVESPAGMNRLKMYPDFRGVPSIAINGKMKFVGIPHPTLLFNEVKRLIEEEQKINFPKYPDYPSSPSKKSSDISKDGKDKFSFYT